MIKFCFLMSFPMKWILLFATFLFFPALQSNEIIMTDSLSEVEEMLDQFDCNSLVLFDVDGTLITADDAILKHHRRPLFKKLIDGHPDRDLFRDIYLKAPHSLVEPASLALIQKLQERKIPTLAFTAAPSKARHPGPLGEWRVEELKRFGFDFSSAFPHHHTIELPKKEDQIFHPLFKSGVLFSSLHSKGEILIHFLEKIEFFPNKVLFIDDELEYVQSVVDSLTMAGIACIGIHYTAAMKEPSHLNLDIARFQVDFFLENDIWLTDQEVSRLSSSE